MRHMREYKLAGQNNRLIVRKCGRQVGAVLYRGPAGLAINDIALIAALIRNGKFSKVR